MKFSHIIEKLVEENITHTHLEQGRKFEKLIQKILQLAPQFQSQFQDVYLWSEFSDEFGRRVPARRPQGGAHLGRFTTVEFWSPAFLAQRLDFLSTPRDDQTLGGRLLLTKRPVESRTPIIINSLWGISYAKPPSEHPLFLVLSY